MKDTYEAEIAPGLFISIEKKHPSWWDAQALGNSWETRFVSAMMPDEAVRKLIAQHTWLQSIMSVSKFDKDHISYSCSFENLDDGASIDMDGFKISKSKDNYFIEIDCHMLSPIGPYGKCRLRDIITNSPWISLLYRKCYNLLTYPKRSQ
jgi:hypothetical protein